MHKLGGTQNARILKLGGTQNAGMLKIGGIPKGNFKYGNT